MLKTPLQEKRLNITLLCLFILFAVYCALRATKGLFLPVEQDDYRDMSIAENMLHGIFFKDTTYQNELLWYNPFLPALDALISRITGLPLNIVLAHTGKFLNILIPVSIYYMGVKLFDRKTALAIAAAAIFFVCGNEYGEHTSGYTYVWLAICFSQVFFYLAITFANKTLPVQNNLNYLLLGLLAGVMFLCHSAMSLLFCITLLCCFFHALIKKEWTFKQFMFKGILYSIGLIAVGAPLLYSIFIHYHYKIKNVDPMQWVAFLLEPEQAYDLFKETFNIYFIIAVVGFIGLIRSKTFNKTARRLILYWSICAFFIFLYVYSIVILRTKYNIILPGFVPSCDAFFCVKSAESVLFGIGFIQVITWLYNKWLQRSKINLAIVFYAALCLLIIFRLPGYLHRKEFVLLKTATLEKQKTFDLEAYAWIKSNTDINDVIFSSMDYAIFPVMASGRKMVAANTYYSSPYISYIDRKKDADSILSGLQSTTSITSLLETYKVKYVLVPTGEQEKYVQAATLFPTIAYQDKNFIIRRRF